MSLTDSRQGYGWISIAFHWVVAIATFYLLYNGLTLEEGEGGRGEFVRGAGGRPAGDVAQRFAEGARSFGEGVANAGRQFAENVFAPRSLHISIGVIAVVLIVGRIVWRLTQVSQPKTNESRVLNVAAWLVQWGLLAALVILAITGPMLVWGMGQPLQVFGWFAIPSPFGAMRNLHEVLEKTHTVAAYAIFPLVGLHILGALKHALIDRDGVVRRMLVARRA